MIAFLKRRWILLSCMLLVAVCGTIDGGVNDCLPAVGGSFGLDQGNFEIYLQEPVKWTPFPRTVFHGVKLGDSPGFHDVTTWQGMGGYAVPVTRQRNLQVPLWVAIAGLLSALAVREMRVRDARWRQWRARQARGAPAPEGSEPAP